MSDWHYVYQYCFLLFSIVKRMAGRPQIDVDYNQLLLLLQSQVKKSDIAVQLQISRPTLDRIISDYQLQEYTQG